MKDKTKKIIYSILAVVLFIIAIALIANTEWFRKWRLGKKLSDKYGVSFNLKADEQDPSFFSYTHNYMLTSDDGIRSYAKCDWKGKLISDSYAHFYYVNDMTRDVESLIGSCFDKCYIVRDCIEYGSNQCLTEFVSAEDSKSFESYRSRKPEVTVTYRVYVEMYVSEEQLRNALDKLSTLAADYSVYFLRVMPAEYEIVNDTGLKCYYPNSDVYEAYRKEYTENHPYLFIKDLESLVYRPFDYTVAEYVPKYESVKVYEDFHERNREYFVNVDKDHTYEEIIADIGNCNGVKGSGIITYIWTLNDGTAHVIFDSSGHIEWITIQDKGKDTFELIYDRYPSE